MNKAFTESVERLLNAPDCHSVMVFASKAKTSKEIVQYLKEKKDKLSPPAKFYLQMKIEKMRKEEVPSNLLSKEIIVLSGKEAEEFKAYRDNKEAKKVEKIFKEFFESNDPNENKIVSLTLQDDPVIIEKYINDNKKTLSPYARAFLENSLKRISKEYEKEELAKAREEAEKAFKEGKVEEGGEKEV